MNSKKGEKIPTKCYCGQNRRCPMHSWAKHIKKCLCGYPVNKYGLCTNPLSHGV